ncbi:type II toxin-antitoxin system death-on-curing family toxin [Streptacidiphilus sp. P02-A3a]|nr:type II toxin-antitoxin system death-on-curing family toxin [Streptacidiphilus sp. P02-A3a]QMU73672.1 type II toxin-antitoxin system death-on-curing family toxin [Streptacidiphilus sp. P02-A3a]
MSVERITGSRHCVRDFGLPHSSVERPRTHVVGVEVYPALLHSLARNHALVDGNKRTAWIAMRMMLRLNGVRLNAPVDDAEVFVNAVATGELEVPEIARQLRAWAVG